MGKIQKFRNRVCNLNKFDGKSIIIRTFAFSAAMTMMATSMYAVPAYRGLQDVKQPDGSIVTIMKVGDERNHFIVSSDGCLLTYGKEGIEYGRLSAEGRIEPTGIIAVNPEIRSDKDRAYITKVEDFGAILSVTSKSTPEAAKAKNMPGRFPDAKFPTEGSPKVLVILVEYNDVKFNLPDPRNYFEPMLNQTGFDQYQGTGCAKEYFIANSGGKFTPQFDVFGPISLSHDRVYYGGNNDLRAHEMVTEAAKMLDSQIDFSQYDNDGDGYVDNIFVIYAGQGEATYGGPDTVWPHAGELINNMVFESLDKTILNRYACCNEWLQSRPDGVGTFIHEFSHVMGLPDLYATQGGRLSATPGSWSALDYGPYNNGGCTPPNYSAFERCAMGWLEPVVLDGSPLNLRLEEISTNQAATIPVSKNGKEYFLIENRQQTGWDTYLPGHGMLVWHIDYDDVVWADNSPNNDPSHQRVDIVEAGGQAVLDNAIIMASYPFPGTKGVTSLGFETTPKLAAWDGSNTGILFEDIYETETGVIRCAVNGGMETIATPEWGSDIRWDKDGMDLCWSEVEDAEYYELEVMANYESVAGTDENRMGKGATLTLPDGWSSGSTGVYTTSGNYGESAPSFKMDEDGTYMESPEYGDDVTGVSFWMKGIQTSGSMLKVLGFKNGEWIVLGEFEPKDNVKKTEKIDVVPGVRRIRFEYSMVKGRVALDDVVINYGSADHALEGYDPKKIEGTTKVRVDRGECTADKYSCRVRSVKGEDKSAWSTVNRIQLSSPGSVINAQMSKGDIIIDSRTISTRSGAAVEVYDMLGRVVARNVGAITIPAAGVYVVKSGSEILKIACE